MKRRFYFDMMPERKKEYGKKSFGTVDFIKGTHDDVCFTLLDYINKDIKIRVFYGDRHGDCYDYCVIHDTIGYAKTDSDGRPFLICMDRNGKYTKRAPLYTDEILRISVNGKTVYMCCGYMCPVHIENDILFYGDFSELMGENDDAAKKQTVYDFLCGDRDDLGDYDEIFGKRNPLKVDVRKKSGGVEEKILFSKNVPVAVRKILTDYLDKDDVIRVFIGVYGTAEDMGCVNPDILVGRVRKNDGPMRSVYPLAFENPQTAQMYNIHADSIVKIMRGRHVLWQHPEYKFPFELRDGKIYNTSTGHYEDYSFGPRCHEHTAKWFQFLKGDRHRLIDARYSKPKKTESVTGKDGYCGVRRSSALSDADAERI